MASPVAHAVISWAALKGAGGWAPWRGAALLAAAALLGGMPDVDYLPGLLAGSMNRWHQGWTHSIGGVVLIAALASGVARALPGKLGPPLRVGVWCLVLGVLHLLCDLASRDTRPPLGIPLLWPLSAEAFHFPFSIFPGFAKQSIEALLTTPGNLIALGIEGAVALPVAFATYHLARLVPGRSR